MKIDFHRRKMDFSGVKMDFPRRKMNFSGRTFGITVSVPSRSCKETDSAWQDGPAVSFAAVSCTRSRWARSRGGRGNAAKTAVISAEGGTVKSKSRLHSVPHRRDYVRRTRPTQTPRERKTHCPPRSRPLDSCRQSRIARLPHF